MLQNKMWAKEVEESSMVTLTLMKEIATHVTLDNNDENQETANGKGTTHYTNMTVFQQILKGKYKMLHI